MILIDWLIDYFSTDYIIDYFMFIGSVQFSKFINGLLYPLYLFLPPRNNVVPVLKGNISTAEPTGTRNLTTLCLSEMAPQIFVVYSSEWHGNYYE